MLYGHGDDAYNYNHPITVNFSSNVYHHTSLTPLFRHLEHRMEQIRTYPEPSPRKAEHRLANAMRLPAETVCLTRGGTEAIYLIAQALSGRNSFILAPTFSEYAAGCTVIKQDLSIRSTACRKRQTSYGFATRIIPRGT